MSLKIEKKIIKAFYLEFSDYQDSDSSKKVIIFSIETSYNSDLFLIDIWIEKIDLVISEK